MANDTELYMQGILQTIKQVDDTIKQMNDNAEVISNTTMNELQDAFNGPEEAHCTKVYKEMHDLVEVLSSNLQAANQWEISADTYKSDFVSSQM